METYGFIILACSDVILCAVVLTSVPMRLNSVYWRVVSSGGGLSNSIVECVTFQCRVTSLATWWQSAELGRSLTFGHRAADSLTLRKYSTDIQYDDHIYLSCIYLLCVNLIDNRSDRSHVQHTLYLFAVEVGQTDALSKTQLHTFLHRFPRVHVVHIAEN